MDLAVEPPKNALEAHSVLDRCMGVPERIELIDNYISEIAVGIGLVLNSSSAYIK
jgi:hypothetical protein